MMVHVYTTSCRENRYRELKDEYLHCLPESFIKRMNAFRFETDAYRFLLGKVLLLKGVAMMGYTDLSLEQLCFTVHNKPFFFEQLSFNISHSGDYVVCALSKTCKVGIDLEQIGDIEPGEFQRCFTPNEWDCINTSLYPIRTFYEFWTKKESVIKADGRGMHIPLQSFEVTNEKVLVDNNDWYTRALPMEDGYVAHLATNVKLEDPGSVLHFSV